MRLTPDAAGGGIRISTLPWIAGAYLLILGTSLLILNPGTPVLAPAMPWLRGAVTIGCALILLWLAAVEIGRGASLAMYLLGALPQLAFGLQYIRQGAYGPGASLVWFALGLLLAAAIAWRRNDPAGPRPAAFEPARAAGWSLPPDLAGFVLAASMLTQGLDNLLRSSAAAGLPQPLAQELRVLGAVYVVGAVLLALAQVLTRLPLGVRWAAHVFAGLTLLGTWVLFSAGGDIGLWLRASSTALLGLIIALLPWIGRRAALLDRRSFYPRLALAFITVATVPLLAGVTALVAEVPEGLALPGRQLAYSVTLVTVALFAAAGAWLASRLARPLELVVAGVDRIASGERNVPMVRRDSPSEVVRLVDAVQNMAGSLDAHAAEQAELAQVAAVQEERQRLARDLHDSVAQTLTAMSMASHSAVSLWEDKPQVARDRIELAGVLARRAQAEMRALIFELRPDQLQVDGLVKALELQIAALEARHEFSIEASFCDEPTVPLAVKEVFYRVAQEALHNAARHARAKRLELTLACDDNKVALSVKDDGSGFDPDAPYPGHLGLRSMRERAERVGAELAIDSAPGGTSIDLFYPSK